MPLLPLLSLAIVETISRGGFVPFYKWIIDYKGEFFINYLILFSLVNLFAVCYWKLYISLFAISTCVLSCLAYVSRVKNDIRGEPLLPWDFKLVSEATDITRYFNSALILKAIVLLAFVILCIVLIAMFAKPKYSLRSRLVISILSVVATFAVFADNPHALKRSLNVEPINWDQNMNYSQNGFLLGFALNYELLSIEVPEGYSRDAVDKAVNSIERRTNVNGEVSPNIVVILGEAFWDPTLLKELSFSSDPIPFFRSLQETSTSGTLLSPVFGGGTVNTEFEVLTGFSTQFIPPSAMAYTSYVHKPMNSLAGILSRQGYKTTALHTYHNWFYRRNKVLQNLGFDNFISCEFFNDPKRKGEYISDKEIMAGILSELQSTEKPSFIFAATMEGHGPYFITENRENTIRVDGNISKESKDIIETYAQAMSDADAALKLLIEGIQKLDKPTIVVYFGDHLPLLGNNFKVYREANFFQDIITYEDYSKCYSTPFVIWNNYTAQKETLRMSPSFVTPYILNMAEKKGTAFTDYLHSLYKSGTALIPKKEFYGDVKVEQSEIEKYKLLQYDLMHGEGYGYQKDELPFANKDYFLGISKMLINEAIFISTVQAGSNQSADKGILTLGVKGEGFVKNSKVFIDGKGVDTQFFDANYLEAAVPANSSGSKDTFEVEVKVIDSMKNVIVQTNKMELRP